MINKNFKRYILIIFLFLTELQSYTIKGYSQQLSYNPPGDILRSMDFTGQRKILFILVQYPGGPGAVITPSEAQSHANIVKNVLERNAYNSVSVTIDITPVLMMPNPASYYQGVNATIKIRADAVQVASNAGYNIKSYDREVIFSSQLWSGAPGLGTLNQRTALMSERNSNLPYVTLHELGHTFGWMHANFWKVSSGSPISPDGTEIEYGDVYDMMGNNIGVNQSGPVSGFYHHFNPWFKSRVNWLPSRSILNVTQSGTYTIEAFDNPPPVSGTSYTALKIKKDAARDYWIFYRSMEEALNPKGPLITEIRNDNIRPTRLLDMTPGSQNDDWRDAALALGQTFSDPDIGLTIKTVSVTSQNVQVEVTIDPNILNQLDILPVINVVEPKNGQTVGGKVDYEVTAFDPEFGDTDGAGIAEVKLFLHRTGDPLGVALRQGQDPPFPEATMTFSSPPYHWEFDTSNLQDGVYFLVARVTSRDGGVHRIWFPHIVDNTSVPTTPLLISPSNGALGVKTNPTLVWHSSDRANTYHLQISTSSDFISKTVNQTDLVDTTFQVTDLSDSTTYYWRVRAANVSGTGGWSEMWSFTTETVTGIETNPGIPEKFNLEQNYPNPFNPRTNIIFELPRSDYVILKIYDITGKEVRTLVSGRYPAGKHTVKFDAQGHSSGVYLYKLNTSNFSQTRKMLLLK